METHEELGRYLNGWRHFENFEFYSLKYPKATVEDYKRDIRSACTFDIYFQLSKEKMLKEMDDPFFQYQLQ